MSDSFLFFAELLYPKIHKDAKYSKYTCNNGCNLVENLVKTGTSVLAEESIGSTGDNTGHTAVLTGLKKYGCSNKNCEDNKDDTENNLYYTHINNLQNNQQLNGP